MSDEKTRAQQQFELDFEAFLRDDESQLAALYRKLPLAAPDAELDARVRALAQRELGAAASDGGDDAQSADAADADLTPTNLYLRHPRWLPALGAAATLVLAAGIAWRMAPSGSSSRERANAPAAVATTTAPEQKAVVDSAVADRKATATPGSAPASAPSAGLAPNRANTLAKAAPADEYARAKARNDVPLAKPEAQAFPAAAAPRETASLESGKTRSAEATRYAPAAPPPPAPMRAEPGPAAAAAAAASPRAGEVASQAATVAGGVLHDAARAPKGMAAPQPPGIAANVQSAMATCPVAQDGGNWRGHYPAEIPPTAQLRREVVKDLIGQARREDARRAYADFHARCPADSWPPDILNQLQGQ